MLTTFFLTATAASTGKKKRRETRNKTRSVNNPALKFASFWEVLKWKSVERGKKGIPVS